MMPRKDAENVSKTLPEEVTRALSERLVAEGKNSDWLAGLQLSQNSRMLLISFAHPYFESWFKRHVQGWFEETMDKIYPAIKYQYRISTPTSGFSHKNSCSKRGRKQTGAQAKKQENYQDKTLFPGFFYGDSNRHVIELLEKTASARNYSPAAILLHGTSGTGKTMLMKLMENLLEKAAKRTLFISAIEFGKKLHSGFYNNFWASHDILLVDDLQDIADVCNLSNALARSCDFPLAGNGEKLAIFSISYPEKLDLNEFDARLRSRLESMLPLELKEPDLPARLKYVEHVNSLKHLKLSRSQILMLVRQKSGFPAMKGLLKRIEFLRATSQELPDMLDADHLADREKMVQPGWQAILDQVGKHFHLKTEVLLENSRKSELVLARQIAMYLCRQHLGLSFKEIGIFMGGKDHSTVMHGIKKIQSLRDSNKDAYKMLQELEKTINISFFEGKKSASR